MKSFHGGNLRAMAEEAGCRPEDILDFSANINPLGLPDWLRQTMSSLVSDLVHYPDPDYVSLREAIAERYGTHSKSTVVGNGASELLHQLPSALQLTHAVIPVPCYAGYERAIDSAKSMQPLTVVPLQLTEEKGFEIDFPELATQLKKLSDGAHDDSSIGVFIGCPNNPTGVLVNIEKLGALAKSYPKVWFILDESFMDFVEGPGTRKQFSDKNIIFVRSMTKILAIPGLRVGFLNADEKVCSSVEKALPMWSVNSVAAGILQRAMQEVDYFEETRKKIADWRSEFVKGLKSFSDLKVFESAANFVLVKLKTSQWTADLLRSKLLKDYKIGIRSCTHVSGLDERYIRLADERPKNCRLLDALSEMFDPCRLSQMASQEKNPCFNVSGNWLKRR